ncbi:hypothetical protein ACZ90_44290 [Streptomyces albus subsp. albus]|nr:hypothetical protein ACZ90_44290 [Streptomyces albus subsp. albus]
MQQIHWRKSSFSGNGVDNACVELQVAAGAIALREGDDPVTMVTTTRPALLHFLRAVKAGQFDRLGSPHPDGA